MSDRDLSDSEVNFMIDESVSHTVSQFSTNEDSVHRLRGCLSYFYEITKPNFDPTSTSTNGDTIPPVENPPDPTQSQAQASTSERNMAKDQSCKLS